MSLLLFDLFHSSTYISVVVRLPRPMEGNGVTPIFSSLQKLQFHHRRLELLGYLIVVLFPYIIIVFLKHYCLIFGVILFLQCLLLFYVYISNFASTLFMYAMYLMSLTDSFDDRWCLFRLI